MIREGVLKLEWQSIVQTQGCECGIATPWGHNFTTKHSGVQPTSAATAFSGVAVTAMESDRAGRKPREVF